MHSMDELRREMMRKYGKGYVEFIYIVDGKQIWTKHEQDIPPGCEYLGLVGSMSSYIKYEIYETTQGMITEMKDDAHLSGEAFDKLIGEKEG